MKVHMLTPHERHMLVRKQWKARQEHRERQRAEGTFVPGFIGWERWEQHVYAVEALQLVEALLSQHQSETEPEHE